MSSWKFVALPSTSVEQMYVWDSKNEEEVRRRFHLAEKSCRRTDIQLVFPVGSCSNMPYIRLLSYVHTFFSCIYAYTWENIPETINIFSEMSYCVPLKILCIFKRAPVLREKGYISQNQGSCPKCGLGLLYDFLESHFTCFLPDLVSPNEAWELKMTSWKLVSFRVEYTLDVGTKIQAPSTLSRSLWIFVSWEYSRKCIFVTSDRSTSIVNHGHSVSLQASCLLCHTILLFRRDQALGQA